MKFANREKIFVYAAVVIICLFLIIELLFIPAFNKKDRLEKELIAKEEGIKELAEMSQKYQQLDRLSGSIEKVISNRNRGFTLFSFLETTAGQAKVKGNITSMKPSETKGLDNYTEIMVEVKLESITLEQLADYLYLIEKPDQLVFIKRISITDNKREKGHLDSILQVLTFN
ncbi:hypothetical protein ACFL1N_03905 [Thermodesulfobacteriota bacterium]